MSLERRYVAGFLNLQSKLKFRMGLKLYVIIVSLETKLLISFFNIISRYGSRCLQVGKIEKKGRRNQVEGKALSSRFKILERPKNSANVQFNQKVIFKAERFIKRTYLISPQKGRRLAQRIKIETKDAVIRQDSEAVLKVIKEMIDNVMFVDLIMEDRSLIILNSCLSQKISLVVPADQANNSLYLGNIHSIDKKTLLNFDIGAVVSAITKAELGSKGQVIADSKVNHLHIDIQDSVHQKIGQHFSRTCQFINQNLKKCNVLVHCKAGVSRSSSLVIAYLIKRYKISFQQAYKKLKRKRLVVSPNKGFIQQLQIFSKAENRLYKSKK